MHLKYSKAYQPFFRMKNTYKVSILLVLFLLNFQAVFAQKNWNTSKSDQGLIYTPKDLKSNEVFRVTFPQPQQLKGQNLKDWTLSQAKKMHVKLGKPGKKWVVKPEKNGAWGISNNYRDASGKTVQVGYQGGTFSNGDGYIFQMVMKTSLSKMIKYGMQTNTLVKSAEKTFNSNTTIASVPTNKKTKTSSSKRTKKSITNTAKSNKKLNPKQQRLAIEAAIRTSPGNGVKANQIETVWIYSKVNVLYGGIDVNTYLLLKDGTAYLDCEIPPNQLDVATSKKLQVAGPIYKKNKWTVWKKSGSGYQIKNVKTGAWTPLKGKKVIKGRVGEKLSKQYISAGGSQYKGSWKYFITFKANGRFEMSSRTFNDNSMMGGGSTGTYASTIRKSDKTGTEGTTVVAGNNVGGGSSSKINDGDKNKGSYKINGYTITLKHDNGYQHTELFFFDKTSKTSFIYGDRKYWIPKKK